MFQIPIGNGQFSVVDDLDMDLALCHSWSAAYNQRGILCGVRATISGKKVYLGRVIADRIGLDLSDEVDHQDTDPLNNKRENLRSATRSQNRGNRKVRSDNGLGAKGVRFNKGAYEVTVKKKYIGRFDSVEEASAAFQEASVREYGSFARS